AACELPMQWDEYRRVSGPDGSGLEAAEAAQRVIWRLALDPASAAGAPTSTPATETAVDAHVRGNALWTQGRLPEALATDERALRRDPQHGAVWQAKGNALWDLARYDEACVAYAQAPTLDPQYLVAWHGKGNALCGLERYDEALASYERALEIDPRFVPA